MKVCVLRYEYSIKECHADFFFPLISCLIFMLLPLSCSAILRRCTFPLSVQRWPILSHFNAGDVQEEFFLDTVTEGTHSFDWNNVSSLCRYKRILFFFSSSYFPPLSVTVK